jgi:hypothetical protein
MYVFVALEPDFMNFLYYQSGCSECAKEERNALMKDLT